ncbi:hypothetical protein Tco_0241146 [Tanacetum coccineum]
MPMHLDQPVNARFVVEIGMGKEVVKNNKGVLMRAKYEKKKLKEILKSSANGRKDKDRVMQGVKWWKNIVLVKSLKEIGGKYVNYLSSLTSKRVVPVGPLVVDTVDVDSEQNSVIQWLDTKTIGSTIFVSLRSEYFLSRADMTQIALGLEMSNVNFIWVLRFLKGENNMTIKEAFPIGFLKGVKTKVMEAMKFGVPIIAMLMHLDQPVTTQLVVVIWMGKEIVRNNKGVLMGLSATMAANMFHLYFKQDVAFPFGLIYYRKYEKKNAKEILESSANGRKDKDRVMQGIKWWKNIVLVKSLKEIEGKYDDYHSILTSKRVVPVGPLVVDSVDVDLEQNSVIKWLDTKATGSTVFVYLGTEIVNDVIVSNLGNNIRDKVKKISDDLETKGDEEIEFVVDELLQLCQSGHKLRRVSAPLQKAKSDGFMIHSWFVVETEYEKKNVKEVFKSSANGRKDNDRVMQGAEWWKSIWLDTKTTGSTISVSFGSGYFLSKADMTQIALGWEISNENFIWVPSFPKGQNNMSIKEALPLGFVEKVKTIDWDGKEVVRNNKGVLIGAKVAEIVNEVVASNIGKNTIDKAKKISDDLETKGDEEIEYVVDELLQLCQSGHKLRRVGAPLQKAKSDGFMIRLGD